MSGPLNASAPPAGTVRTLTCVRRRAKLNTEEIMQTLFGPKRVIEPRERRTADIERAVAKIMCVWVICAVAWGAFYVWDHLSVGLRITTTIEQAK
jgi:hypothetical protein